MVMVLINYIQFVGDNMKNNKGFTLVEVLAVLIIISLLLLVAIPNVSTILNNSKKETFISNASSFIRSFKAGFLARDYVVEGNESVICSVPPVGKYISISLSEIEVEKDSRKSSWGIEFDNVFSYVVVKNMETPSAPSGSNKVGKLVYYFVGYDKEFNGFQYLVEESNLHTKFVQVGGKGGLSYDSFLQSKSLTGPDYTSSNSPTDSNIRFKRSVYLYDSYGYYSSKYRCVSKG